MSIVHKKGLYIFLEVLGRMTINQKNPRRDYFIKKPYYNALAPHRTQISINYIFKKMKEFFLRHEKYFRVIGFDFMNIFILFILKFLFLKIAYFKLDTLFLNIP